MTIRELSKLYWLNREIEGLRGRLAELRARATDSTQKITGMPHVPGAADKVGTYAVEIAELQKQLERSLRQSCQERNRLNGYINQIQDPYTRELLRLRFVQGMSWEAVADAIGGGVSGEFVRVKINRLHKKSKGVQP